MLALKYFELGEISSGQAAQELRWSAALIDERRARRIAAEIYGPQVKGTCALLLRARQKGLPAAIGPVLAQMKSEGDSIGESLRHECLRRAGEVF